MWFTEAKQLLTPEEEDGYLRAQTSLVVFHRLRKSKHEAALILESALEAYLNHNGLYITASRGHGASPW